MARKPSTSTRYFMACWLNGRGRSALIAKGVSKLTRMRAAPTGHSCKREASQHGRRVDILLLFTPRWGMLRQFQQSANTVGDRVRRAPKGALKERPSNDGLWSATTIGRVNPSAICL
jgi:hypothetical protein